MATTNPYDDQIKDLTNTSQITADTQDFDESKGVAGRVDTIIKEDSPLMQLAATRAKQDANARGLRNSSMAVSAGHKAVFEAATPIAGADANLYQNQQLANQAARNQTNQFNSNSRTQIGLSGMDLGQRENEFGRSLMEQARQFDKGIGHESKLADNQLKMQQTIAKMDADSRAQLANIEAGFKTGIASNENISRAWGSMMEGIAQIQNNPDLDASTKKQLIENTIGGFQSFTSFWNKVTGGAVDVSDLLDFGVESAGKTPAPAPKPGEPGYQPKPGYPLPENPGDFSP